jgi:hypothetical protein
MSVCHLDILSSRSIVDLLKPLGYGSHCWEGVNGNPVLTLDYFSLLERLVESLVRSIASLFNYARVPSSECTGPTVGYSTAHGLQSRSRCRRSFTYLGFRGATLVSPAGIRTLDARPGFVIPFRKVAVPLCEGRQIALFPFPLSLHLFHPHPTLKLPQAVLSSKHPSQGSAARPVSEG